MYKRIIIGAVCVVVALVVFFGGKYLYDVANYKRILEETEISTPDLSLIQDGTYNGYFGTAIVSADVDVIVSDHKITDIVINSHKNERGATAESIIDEVLAQQSLAVDTISGATNSSKVILKAIEFALESTETRE